MDNETRGGQTQRDTVKWEGRYADVFSKQYSVCLECNIHEEK